MKPLVNPGLLRELQAILTIYLFNILGGYGMGYSAIAIPDINKDMRSGNGTEYYIPNIQATSEQLSWFASVVNIGQIFGSLIGGFLAVKYGPKKMMQMSCGVMVLGWLCLAVSPHLSLLIIARVICGVGGSMPTSNMSLLVAQYSSMKWRGAFLSLFALMVGFGILLCYSLGTGLYWRYVATVPPILYILLAIGLFFIPESPIWLLGHKGESEAREALQWIRCNEDVEEEIQNLQATREKQTHALTMTEAIRNLSRYEIRAPFLFSVFVFIFTLLSGPFAIIFYAVEIFKAAGLNSNEHLAAIITAVVRIFGGILGIFLVQKLPRVKLAMAAMTLMSLSMIALGIVIHIKDKYEDNVLFQVLPIVFVTLYMFSFGAGAGPLQWVFLAELLPPEYKALSGVITSISSLTIFIVTKMFPTLLHLLGPEGTYWLFGSIAMASNIFYYFFMPETKGKSFLEMQQYFLKR